MSEVDSVDEVAMATAATAAAAKTAKKAPKPRGRKKKTTTAAAAVQDDEQPQQHHESRNLQQEINDGVHGFCVKFVYHYSRQLGEFREMMDMYDEIESRFSHLCAQYTMNTSGGGGGSKRPSSSLPKQGEVAAVEEPKVVNKAMRKVNEDVLLKKFQTPLESRTKASMFATGGGGQSLLKAVMPHKQLFLAREQTSSAEETNKKKRKTAEQSMLLEKAAAATEKENENETLTESTEDAKKRKKIKTKKKKGAKKGGDTLIEDNPLTDLGSVVDDAVEIVCKSNVVDKLSIKAESNSSMVKATSNNSVKTITKTSIKTEVTVEKSGSDTTTTTSSETLGGGKHLNQPSKKIRISSQDESHLEPLREREEDASPSRASNLSCKSSTSKKKYTKKSLTKAKKAGKSSMVKAGSSNLADPLASSTMSNQPAPSTPNKSSLMITTAPGAESILYSNSKTTVKQQVTTTNTRPLTRRAATGSTKAAPGAATSTTTTTTTTTCKIDASAQTPGKVKQMVNMVEARLKTHGPDMVPSTPFSTIKKNQPTSQLLSTIKAKVNPVSVIAAPAASTLHGQKIRSSIDNRKIRTSNAKAEAKRQSAKRVNAFLSNLAENIDIKHVAETPAKQQQQQQQHNETIDMTNTPVVGSKDRLLADLKPVQTAKKKLFDGAVGHENGAHHVPDPSTQVKAVSSVSVIDHSNANLLATVKRPMSVRELINANSTVSQQYRIAPIVKNTPSHHRAAGARTSFAKFIERNTPSKLTRTEMEEKRKAELAAKQAKEAERIQELNSIKSEKIENKKKQREEKMRKINELKIKQQEEEAKRREEIDAKLQMAEENKKKMLEEKRKEEYEKQKQREQRLQAAATAGNTDYHAIQVVNPSVLASAQKKPAAAYYSHVSSAKPTAAAPVVPSSSFYSNSTINYGATTTSVVKPEIPSSSSNNYDSLSTFKPTALSSQQVAQLMKGSAAQPLKPMLLNQHGVPNNFVKPVITDSAIKSSNYHSFLKPQDSNNKSYTIGPSSSTDVKLPAPSLALTKLNPENYDVSGLRSDDDTDDEEDPSKPIPAWAKQPLLGEASRAQSHKFINYTKLFKAACQNEINLDEIFKYKRKKFNERSSSANWSSPPVWRTNGISGEESFRQFQRL